MKWAPNLNLVIDRLKCELEYCKNELKEKEATILRLKTINKDLMHGNNNNSVVTIVDKSTDPLSREIERLKLKLTEVSSENENLLKDINDIKISSELRVDFYKYLCDFAKRESESLKREVKDFDVDKNGLKSENKRLHDTVEKLSMHQANYNILSKLSVFMGVTIMVLLAVVCFVIAIAKF